MSLPEATAVPCSECPWRRISAPGWLGPNSPKEWITLAHSDQAIACHLTIAEDESWTAEGVRQCRGAAQYRANVGKLPRDGEVAVGPTDKESTFASPGEFLAHHEPPVLPSAR